MRVIATLALAASFATGVWAQQQSQPKQEVTIVATGKGGAPVTDLKVEDIVIKDNTKKQEIISFEKVTPDTEPGPGKPGVHNLILLDELNSTYRDLPENRAEMVRLIDVMSKAKNVTFLTLRSKLAVLHDPAMTGDTVLRKFAAMKPTGLEAPKFDLKPFDWLFESELGLTQLFTPSAIMDRQRVELSLDSLQTIAGNLRGRPGRKNLFWISQGFPLVFGGPAGFGGAAMDTVMGGGTGTGASIGSKKGQDVAGEGSHATDLKAYAKDIAYTANVINNANVAVYPVDSRFLTVNDAVVSDTSMMNDIAKATGGVAYTSRRDVAAALQEGINDSKVVYIVRYNIAGLKYDGSTREIKVECKRKDVKLRYRGSYFVPEAKK